MSQPQLLQIGINPYLGAFKYYQFCPTPYYIITILSLLLTLGPVQLKKSAQQQLLQPLPQEFLYTVVAQETKEMLNGQENHGNWLKRHAMRVSLPTKHLQMVNI